MEQSSDLGVWKNLLEELESSSTSNKQASIIKLSSLFDHLSPQTAPRLQKEYELCTIKSDKLLGDLFDSIDLSDKPLLCSYLGLLMSFGYFRIAQITYHIEKPNDQLDSDTIHFPNIEKVKWYDMCPLLPKAGTIGWKSIMNHGLVKEERQLLQACLQLLSQKLHFYSIISMLDRFQNYRSLIERNGEKVVAKLFELIRDIAYDEDAMIGLDESLFNLLLPFTSEEQQSVIIDATVQDLFKPFMLQKPVEDKEVNKIYELINGCIMPKAHLQDMLITSLFEHLKSNVIRHKRRRSVEPVQETIPVTFENLLEDISKGENIDTLLLKIDGIELSAKSLQTGYISYWLRTFDRILPQRNITAFNSQKLIITCYILLIKSWNIITPDLFHSLSSLMASTLENSGQLNKLLNTCDPQFLIEMTKNLSEKTGILSIYDTPLLRFYRSYVSRYLKHCILKASKLEAESFQGFVTSICDKSLSKDTSHILQYICIHELAGLFGSLKSKVSNKILDTFLECAQSCSKRLHRFIKRNSPLRNDTRDNEDEDMDTSDLNNSEEQALVDAKKTVVVDALVCIITIAVEREDQAILDSYSDLLLKLCEAMALRLENLIELIKFGSSEDLNPLDVHLSKLLLLYIQHKDIVKAYLNYDLIDKLSSVFFTECPYEINGSTAVEVMKSNKKLIYNQLKTKLEDIDNRANSNADVYRTIINKQYSSVVDQSIGSIADIKREKPCCYSYRRQLKIFGEVTLILLNNCEDNVYRRILENTVSCLEQCDPLDHTRVMYFLLMIETLIPKSVTYVKNKSSIDSLTFFKEMLPRISCSLIRISKSVELGPSIHVFTRAGVHKSNRGVQCCTYSNCIKIYSQIFLNHPPKTTDHLITDAMEICVSSNLIQYSKNSTRLHKFFVQLATAIVGLLKSVCIARKEEETYGSSMPIVLSMLSHVIRCLVMASDRKKLEVIPSAQMNGHGDNNNNEENLHRDDIESDASTSCKKYEVQLELIALDLGRTLNKLSSLKVKLVDYAPHLISSYIKDIQSSSCPEYVRLHLNEGIFRIFNLIDAHQKERQEGILDAGVQRKTLAGRASGSLFEMIYARLDQASREIFRDMHDNYNRFHRYLGKC